MINYVLLAIGIFTVLAASILIFLDKVRGEDIYFSIDVKEQEIKKVIEDADEIISELNYTSEMVVKEIEEKLEGLRTALRNITANTSEITPIVDKSDYEIEVPPVNKAENRGRKKKITKDDADKDKAIDGKLSTKQKAILNYAAQGMSVTDIAKKLNIGQGEVMLILSLNNEVE